MAALTDASFDQRVLNATTPVVVMMWQQGCRPCKDMVPVLQDVAREHQGIQFKLLNATANPRTKARYSVTACPATLLFHRGQYLGRWLGRTTKDRVSAWLQRTLEPVDAGR